MAVVVRIADLVGNLDALPTAQGGVVVDFYDASVAPAVHARTFWGLVLLLALRDRARSIHYHPWREIEQLSYVIGSTACTITSPPPATFGQLLFATARDIFAPRPSWRERLFGRAATICTDVALDVGGAWCWWDAVLWSSDWRSGVELFRISPSPPQE